MNPQVLAILAALAAVVFVLLLVRRGILPERFAVLWIAVSFGGLLLAIFPRVLTWAADLAGVEVVLNLVLFAAAVMLLLVSVQLSYEVGRLESRTRRLAEEVAILTEKVERADEQAQASQPSEAAGSKDPAGEPTQPGDEDRAIDRGIDRG